MSKSELWNENGWSISRMPYGWVVNAVGPRHGVGRVIADGTLIHDNVDGVSSLRYHAFAFATEDEAKTALSKWVLSQPY